MSAKQKVIVNTPAIALLYKISAGALTLVYTLPNVKAKIKALLSASESAGGENIDYTVGDGSILRFPKFGKVISGVDDSDITPATSSTTATGEAEATLTIAEAPNEMGSMTALIKDLITEKDTKFLIVIPTGFTYQGQITDNKADGWAYVIGKRTSDLEMDYADGVKELSVVFASNSDSTVDSVDFTGLTFPAVAWRAGGVNLTPTALVSGDATDLIAGKLVIKPTTYV